MPKDEKLGLLYEYVWKAPSADHFTVYPGDPVEIIVYRTLDGPGGNERGKVPVVQGNLNQVLAYMKG
jgi:hypothetical protein